MTTRPASARTRRAAATIGEQLAAWRRLLGLTAEQVAERAGISRGSLHRLETGTGAVNLMSFLEVARALGQLDSVTRSLDPYETDLGRARADQQLPQRVRARP